MANINDNKRESYGESAGEKGEQVIILEGGGGGSGTVTSMSVVTANGISATITNATTTPALTFTLGAITPTTVNGLTFVAQAVGFTIAGGTTSKTLTVALDASVAGTNSGDNATNTQYSGLAASKEDVSNKVTSISGASTDVQYPSAKLVYDQFALKVPYTGATSDLVLGSHNFTQTGYHQFANLSTPSTPASGTVNIYGQNAPSGVTRLLMQTASGAELAFFRDSVLTIRNTTGSTISKAKVVYINGSNGITPTTALAQANAYITSADIGFAVANISNNSYGTIQTGGEFTGLDTTGYSEGDTIYLDPSVAGGTTNVAPTTPNFRMKLGTVITSSANGKIQIMIQPYVPVDLSISFSDNTTGDASTSAHGYMPKLTAASGTGVPVFTQAPTFTTATFASASSITLGTASSAAGGIIFKNATNANTLTIQSGVTGATIAYTLPATAPTDGQVLSSLADGTMSWLSSPQFTTIELGHASDTTLSRVSAGKIAVEGVNQGTEGILQNSQSAAYTTVLTDAGKHIYHPSADTTARTWTIDSNANVAYPIGTAITFVNDTSAGTLTIAITSDTLVLAGAGTTGSRTLAANGVATAIKVTSTRWIISGTNLT